MKYIIQLRDVEEGISIPGDQGKILPLPRVARNPPWITKDLIPDDGFVHYFIDHSVNLDPYKIQPKILSILRICKH